MVIGKDYLRKLHEPSAKLNFEGAELSVNVPGKGTLIVVMQVRFHWKTAHPATGSSTQRISSRFRKSNRWK